MSCSKQQAPLDESEPEFRITAPANWRHDIDKTEKAASDLSRFVRANILDATGSQDFTRLPDLFDANFRGRWPAKTLLNEVQTGTISIWQMTRRGSVHDREAFVSVLQRYFSDAVSMPRRSWKMFEARLDLAKPSLFFGRAHLLLAGKLRNGHAYQLAATVRLRAQGQGQHWSILAWDFEDLIWSEASALSFVDVSSMTGFQFRESVEDQRAAQALINMRRLYSGSGLTVFDANQDGFWDILSTRKGRGANLFINDGIGGFQGRSILPKNRGEDAANFYLAVDVDEDGRKDLIGTHVVSRKNNHASLGLYLGTKTGFRENETRFRFNISNGLRELDFSAIVTCDVNGDSALDYIVLGYLHANSGGDQFNLVDGQDGLRNLLFVNQGKGRFKELGQEWGLTQTQYSYVAECHDFDGDGDVDLFVGNDYGNNNYFENDGKSRFLAQADHPFASARGFTMGFSMADFDNSGRWSVSLSNMYSHAGNRIVPLASQLSKKMRASVTALAGGNNVFEQSDTGWVDQGEKLHLNYAQWAWGNTWFDFDNDGDKDQYVVNGFTTHSDPEAPDY